MVHAADDNLDAGLGLERICKRQHLDEVLVRNGKRKAAKPVRPKYERPCDLVSYSPTLTSVPFLKTKVIAPFLWTIAFSTITVQMVSLHSRSTTGCFLRVRM